MSEQTERFELAIIGAGFAGLGAAAQLIERGERDFVVLEAEAGVGGTWRANTYPGCACDVPSHLYSFSFARSPEWSHAYARQPEILDYLERFTDDRGLRRFIRFETPAERAEWDEARALWKLETPAGRLEARHLILGTGPLRIPKLPELPGQEAFSGPSMHTARWRDDVAIEDARVAVIGTGASAIQVIPEIAKRAKKLTVFQRTPPWVLPRVDGPISERRKAWFRRWPALGWLFRAWLYLVHELLGSAFFAFPALGRLAERRARRHLRASVKDPKLREALSPRYRLGCKRVLLSNTYYPALEQENVEVVPRGVRALSEAGVVDELGETHPADVVVYATGFEVERFVAPLELRGRGGLRLEDRWRDRAAAHLGITVPEFPNLYLLLGPNTGLGHTSVVFMIEAQIRYVLRLLDAARAEGRERVEVRERALAGFVGEIERRLGKTVWNAGGCRSWYLDARGQNVILWPGYTVEYWWRTRRPRLADFELSPAREAAEEPPRCAPAAPAPPLRGPRP